jgi:chorismate dehydratase
MELIEDYPARIAGMLAEGTIDVGLVPVAIIPKLKEYHIISDYCIGAEKPVASVCIFSQVPITDIRTLVLDYQSRTSVNLARVLLKHYWNISPALKAAAPGFEEEVRGTEAAVIIGDRALEKRGQYAYVYDLAEHWMAFTGMPFVFAAWIANRELPRTFTEPFNVANNLGLEYIDKVIAENPYTAYDLKTYYTQNIDYFLSNRKRQGLERFLELLRTLED